MPSSDEDEVWSPLPDRRSWPHFGQKFTGPAAGSARYPQVGQGGPASFLGEGPAMGSTEVIGTVRGGKSAPSTRGGGRGTRVRANGGKAPPPLPPPAHSWLRNRRARLAP